MFLSGDVDVTNAVTLFVIWKFFGLIFEVPTRDKSFKKRITYCSKCFFEQWQLFSRTRFSFDSSNWTHLSFMATLGLYTRKRHSTWLWDQFYSFLWSWCYLTHPEAYSFTPGTFYWHCAAFSYADSPRWTGYQNKTFWSLIPGFFRDYRSWVHLYSSRKCAWTSCAHRAISCALSWPDCFQTKSS